MDKRTKKMEFTIPNFLGIPASVLTFLFGVFKLLEGNIMGGLLSGLVAIMSGIYLYFKIRGQQLDNQKKSLRYSVWNKT